VLDVVLSFQFEMLHLTMNPSMKRR